jgi:hypothetical protein
MRYTVKNVNNPRPSPAGNPGNVLIKGRVSVARFFASGFFHESVSPKNLIIPLGPFSQIRGDIRSSRFSTGVVDTGGKWKKSSIRKFVMISFGHLWVVELA